MESVSGAMTGLVTVLGVVVAFIAVGVVGYFYLASKGRMRGS